MLCLCGFELYSRWVPLLETSQESKQDQDQMTFWCQEPKLNHTIQTPSINLLTAKIKFRAF